MRHAEILRKPLPTDLFGIASGQGFQFLPRGAPITILAREAPAEFRRELKSLRRGDLGEDRLNGPSTELICDQFLFLREGSIRKNFQDARTQVRQ